MPQNSLPRKKKSTQNKLDQLKFESCWPTTPSPLSPLLSVSISVSVGSIWWKVASKSDERIKFIIFSPNTPLSLSVLLSAFPYCKGESSFHYFLFVFFLLLSFRLFCAFSSGPLWVTHFAVFFFSFSFFNFTSTMGEVRKSHLCDNFPPFSFDEGPPLPPVSTVRWSFVSVSLFASRRMGNFFSKKERKIKWNKKE